MANHNNVPPFFLCPISHDIMNDPVTISSGITFDRDSIQKWLVFYNKDTCPITKQPLPDKLLTPNSNLLRLINSWLLLSDSIPVDPPKLNVHTLIDEFTEGPDSVRVKLMSKMKVLIGENDRFKNFAVDAGVDAMIVTFLVDGVANLDSEIFSGAELEYVEEAVSFLSSLKIPRQKLKILSQDRNWKLVDSLSILLTQRTITTHAKSGIISLLKSIFRAADDQLHRMELRPELFDGISEIVKDQNSGGGSTAAALSTLVQILPDENNRRKAVEAGLVPVLIELLSESTGRRACEQILLVVESLCKVGGGRAAVLEHPAGVAAVSSKILAVSQTANDRAVSVVLSLFRYCRVGSVAWELIEVGGVGKMRMVVQSECRAHTKDMAKEILGFYLKCSTEGYPCLSNRFIL